MQRWSAEPQVLKPYMPSTAGPRLHAAAQLERGGVHERQRRGAVGQHDGIGRVVECGAPAVPQRRRGRLRDVEVARLVPVRLAALPRQLQQPARQCARSERTAGRAFSLAHPANRPGQRQQQPAPHLLSPESALSSRACVGAGCPCCPPMSAAVSLRRTVCAKMLLEDSSSLTMISLQHLSSV